MEFTLTECPECGYKYKYLADLSEEEVDNLRLADMYDCETCNTLLPAWAAARQKESTAMGDEKAAEYEALSGDWPKDREVGAMNPAEVPDEDDQDPQETPADDTEDKTSAIVFDDEDVDGIDEDAGTVPDDEDDDDNEVF